MKPRDFFAIQLDRVMKVGPVVNTGLLIATLSLTAARFIYWRGGDLWMWALGCAILTALGILLFAHLWTNRFDMVRASRRASAIHDPCQVYQMHPYERAIWLNVTIPQLELQVQIAEKLGISTESTEYIRGQIHLMKKWEDLGYIPREDYPKHLLHYYWHDEAPL